MKTYPSIDGGIRRGVPVYIFDKIDGSLIRAEFSRKQGWYKFGRKNALLDDSNPVLREAPKLFFELYADPLARIFRQQRWDRGLAFFEFYGPNSFAGAHADEPHMISLFDVSIHPKGFLEPGPFLKLFGDLPGVERLLHHGNFTQDIQHQVEDGTLEGMTFEGVVCKGFYASPGLPMMFKYKSRGWLDRLHAKCGDNEALFNELR